MNNAEQQWEAMTDQQKVEWLATEVMGWHQEPDHQWNDHSWWAAPDGKCYHPVCNRIDTWNPLTDWNHWRSVEMKVMEDEDIFDAYISEMIAEKELGHCCVRLIANDLHTRAKALFLAFHSLPH